jgi:hypothetical protein
MLHQQLDPRECLSALPESHTFFENMEVRLREIRKSGQSVQGVATIHPDDPSKFLVANVFVDCLCCRELGIPFCSYVYTGAFKPGEAIAIRIEHLLFHEPDGIFEISELLQRYFEAIEAKSWKDVSKSLCISTSDICRTRPMKRIPLDERPSFQGLPRSHALMIGSLTRRDQRREAIRFAKQDLGCCSVRELKRYLADLKYRPNPTSGYVPNVRDAAS